MPVTTVEAPRGAKLITNVLGAARDIVVERFRPSQEQARNLLGSKRIKIFDKENTPVIHPVESQGYLYTFLLEEGIPEEALNEFYFKRPDEHKKRIGRGDILWQPQDLSFQISESLREGLRSDDLAVRSENALHLGIEALRYNISFLPPERELMQRDHWSDRTKKVVYDEFDDAVKDYQKRAGEIGPNILRVIKDGLVDLVYNPRTVFTAIGGRVVLSLTDNGITTVEYVVRGNADRHEEVVTYLASEPQTELVSRLKDLGLKFTPGILLKNAYMEDVTPTIIHKGGRTVRQYPVAVSTRMRDFGMGSRQLMQAAYMESTIPERLEWLPLI